MLAATAVALSLPLAAGARPLAAHAALRPAQGGATRNLTSRVTASWNTGVLNLLGTQNAATKTGGER
jgi:hypothetical protein